MATQLANLCGVAARDRLAAALVQRIESGAVDLPLLPQVAGRVLHLTHDANADAAGLSALIHQDQALAARVLRIANSPAYMPRMPIVSLQQAVARLGMNLLAEIALIASIRGGGLCVPGYDAEVKQLWRHALASGAWAKEVARLRRLNVESAFLCGLLHGIGKPVVLQAAVRLAHELSLDVDRPAMLALMEEHHARVGVLIAVKWSLPKQVGEAIAYYLEYAHAPSFAREATITCLADRLATHLLTPDGLDEAAVRAHQVVSDLNLYPDDMGLLLGLRETVLAQVEALAI